MESPLTGRELVSAHQRFYGSDAFTPTSLMTPAAHGPTTASPTAGGATSTDTTSNPGVRNARKGSTKRRSAVSIPSTSYAQGTDSEGANSLDGREDETPEQRDARERTRRQANNARERLVIQLLRCFAISSKF